MRVTGTRLKSYYPSWAWHREATRHCAKHNARRQHESAQRRAAKANASPPWADHVAIRTVYERAGEIQRATGRKVHVDHIVPLRGRVVSGLHVANNLQIISAQENMRKSNKFTGDVGELPAGASLMKALPE